VSPRFDNLMMSYPLTLTHFFERSRRLFARKTIATRVPGKPLFRYTYGDFAERTMRLAGALAALGVRRGDRVATFAWNSHRHLELYWATPLSGAVLHTLNIRLSPLDLTYIVNHAGDSVIFADASLWPVLAAIRDKLPTVRRIVIMPDGVADAAETAGREHGEYEALLAAAQPVSGWPELRETDAAGMCYTSGTTGHPKGVVYTHRAMFLHCLAEATTDLFGISENDRILHIVPMFHANSWCLPYTALMAGADQIFAGPNPQPPDICRMIQGEKVTFTGAVPTVWIAIKELCEREGYDISSLRTIAIGGSAAPRSLQQAYAKNFGVQMSHAWGMTEMTPLGTVTRLKSYMGTGRRRRSTTCTRVWATPRSASTPGSSPIREPSSRGTARAWASCRCAGPGWSRPTTTTPSPPTGSPRTGGSAPGTSPRSTRRATSRSPTGPRT